LPMVSTISWFMMSWYTSVLNGSKTYKQQVPYWFRKAHKVQQWEKMK
jgi:hypothetical protein